MKRQLHYLTIAISLIIISTMTSCKKYTCQCTAYNTNNSEPGGQSNYTVKKKDRTKMCVDKSTQSDSYGNYTTCILK